MPEWNPFRKKESEPAEKPDQNKTDIDNLVERLGASIEEKLKPVREEFTALKTDWEAIKAAATREVPPPPDSDNPPAPPTDNEKRLLALAVATNARMTEAEVISEISGKWGQFVPKIKEHFANTPIERKAQPDYAAYCRNVMKMVIGEAALTSGLSYDGQGKRFFLEDAAARNSNGEPSVFDGQDVTWTDPRNGKVYSATDQLNKLGISVKDFEKSVKEGVV